MSEPKAAKAPKASNEGPKRAKESKSVVTAFVSFASFVIFVLLFGAFDTFYAFGTKQSRIDSLVAAVRPALPFPSSSADGELPADSSAQSKWFVVWPTEADDTRIIVKANPLHPDTQKAGADAMSQINAAVAAAERKAQAAYDKALDELRRTGKASDFDSITLEDEGIAGERIDAELEVIIELQPAATTQIASGETPVLAQGVRGATWMVTIPANSFRAKRGADTREHFRAAETRLLFGPLPKPAISRKGDEPLFEVSIAGGVDTFVVVVRGNEALVKQIAAAADWTRLR
jgi:hypothetical protein